MLKFLSKKIIAGLVLGLGLAGGIILAVAFTEPTTSPTSFTEPDSINDRGDWLAYGRGWKKNTSGDASVSLTQSTCENASNWYWFEDGNGDGDYTDEEDGICVLDTETTSKSWNGCDDNGQQDNTYLASYECEGVFPNGTIVVGTYRGVDSVSGEVYDTTWNNGDCALCQSDCYDGKKDLPDNPYDLVNHYLPSYGSTGHLGSLTPEVLKSWIGTKLPTSNDFFGFCGYKNGGSDYETACSANSEYGNYGQMMGRTDECLDLANSTWEWLAEQHYSHRARGVGGNACSYFSHGDVTSGARFRAVFRP